MRAAFFLLPFLSAIVCRNPERGGERAMLAQKADAEIFARAGGYLASLIRPNGVFRATADETPDSDVFQTAFALSALITLDEAGGNFSAEIQKGRSSLLSRQREVGLWSFKGFLPPDLDDSTAVFRVLDWRDEHSRLLMGYGLQRIFSFQSANGGIQTWLAQPENPILRRMLAADPKATEPDIEVLAFFAGFLDAFEDAKYTSRTSKIVDFLIAQSVEKKRLKASWYIPELYSIYRLGNIIRQPAYFGRISPGFRAEIIRRLKSPRISASFLNRAFGIEIIRDFRLHELLLLSEKWAQELVVAQAADGSWPGEPFFLDVTHRLAEDNRPKLEFGNALYSTALIAEILLRHHAAQRAR